MAQYNVNLSFSADTGKAKAQLQDLQKQLTNLINMPQSKLGIEGDIQGAVRAAAELKTHLQAATNVKTGNLDFVKLNQSLTKSQGSLEKYAEKLQSLGPAGQQAFITLTQAVAAAEIPIKRSSEAIEKMWSTFKNTVRWQISSTVLQGFTGAIETAYNYAQDLNESLNDIRIVTGQNTDEMAKFAKEANTAAKALSTSTTNYTKASLIYYQQGLSDQQVKERTDITIKMANVTRSSAEDVSDQMTAVWNNFYDGSKSLEHYADVMTALGAATASSTDEISEGLNKFAAVAETVGLSYEYAAAALATVTSTTRESADIVGNAFKTLFARIQSLKLGETLDDGTTLGKYSEALASVGIDIKGVNGELKDMDTLLNEMGAKWNTLSKDQQVALAQSVAGVRQYTQLIALMDNWNFFQSNLTTANTSEGALQEQADIYAESWEAASKRVEAAAQSIYEKLMNDEFFIDLLNNVEKILGFVDNLIDGLGGLKGVLLTLGAVMTRVFSDKLSQSLTNLTYNLKMMTKTGREDIQRKKNETLDKMLGVLPANQNYTSDEEKARITSMRKIIELQNDLAAKAAEMSETELTTNQYLLDRAKILAEEKIAATKKVEDAKNKLVDNLNEGDAQIIDNYMQSHSDTSNLAKDTKKSRDSLKERKQDLETISSMETGFLKVKKAGALTADSITEIQTAFKDLTSDKAKALKPIIDSLTVVDKKSEDWESTIENLQVALNILYSEQKKRLTSENGQVGITDALADKMIKNAKEIAEKNVEADESTKNFDKSVDELNSGIKDGNSNQEDWAKNLVSLAGTITAVASSISSIVGLIDVWNNEDITFGEKLLTTFSTLAMVIPMLVTAFTGLNLQQLAGAAAAISHALGLSAEAVAAEVAAGATVSFGTALYAVLWPIGLVMLAIAALVGVIWLISKGIEALNNAYNKDAIAAEKAAEKARELAEAYNETKQAYEDLKASITDYYDAQAAIDELTEGTEEWFNAIQAANEQVMQLLETYPELAQYVTNTGGRLTISKEGFEAVKQEYAQRQAALYNVSMDANVDAKKARTQADKTALVRDKLSSLDSKTSQTLMWTTALGATAGIASRAFLANDAMEEKKATEAINSLTEAFLKDGNAIFADFDKTLADLNITDKDLIERLKENKDAVKELVASNKANLEYEKTVEQRKVDNLLASQGFTSEHYRGQIQTLARDKYNEISKSYDSVYNREKWRTGLFNDRTQAGVNAVEDYARIMGYEGVEVGNFRKNKVKIKYTDENGETQKKLINYSDIEKTLKEYAISQDTAIKQYAQRLTNTIVSLENVGTKEADALGAFLEEGNLSYVSPEAFEELKNGNLHAIFPSGTDVEQVAKDFGYESVAALQEAIANAPYDPAQAVANIARRTAEEINAIFSANAQQLDTTTEALEAYAAHLIEVNEGLADNKKMAAQAAVEHFRMAKALNNLQEVFAENAEVLREADENSIDYYEALGKVAQAVEDTFGLKVSAEFIKDNLEDIERMAEGDEKALARLRKEVNKDWILNLNISEDNKNALAKEIDELSALAENAPIGTQLTLDNSDAIAAINEALYTGSATIEDIEAMFNNANLQMPEYHTKTVPGDAVTSHSTTEFEGPLGIKWSAKSTTTTTTDRTIPYFGDAEPTVNDGVVDYGKSSSIAVKSTGNLNSLGTALDYKGEDSSSKDKKEIDRYHRLEKQLEDLERDYAAIANARERAFGRDKLNLYDQEISKLQELHQAAQSYADEAKGHYYADKNALLSKYGVILDKDGNISNYEEMFAEHGQSENFQELVSNYEESLSTWKDKLQEVIDKHNELVDLKLEKIQYQIDLDVKLDDQQQEYLDFLIKMADDPLNDAAVKLSKLTEKWQSSNNLTTKMQNNLKEALDVTGWDSGEIDQLLAGENLDSLLAANELTETQIEMLEQYRDQLYTTTEMMMTWADDIRDVVIEAFDELNKEFEDSTNQLNRYNKILTTYQNIIDLVGEKTLGIDSDLIAQLSQASVDNAMATLEVNKTIYDRNKAALDELLKQDQTNWSEDAKEAWDEAVKHAEEAVRESEATMFDSWENALQAAADAFANAVETAVKAYEASMSGLYGSFDAMQTAYDQQSTLNERYLADYEKIYQLSKLNRQVTNSIDETDNVKAKTTLAKLQKEILALSESDAEVSEYQVEYLQKQYDLKMAQIALEDAQNAKSQVRMQRDAEGNWSYVYTADQNQVDSAQQDYEDKLYALQDFNQKYIQENSDALMQLQKEYADALSNIKREDFETQADYEAALKKTTDYYQTMINYRTEQLGLATTNAATLYDTDWQKYSEITGYKISKDNEWVQSFGQTQIAIVGNYKTISDYQDAFKTSSTQLINALTEAYGKWRDAVDDAMEKAGTSTKGFATQVDTDTQNIQEDTATIVGSLEDLGKTATETFNKVVGDAASAYTQYSKTIQSYINDNLRLIESLNAVIAKKAEAAGTGGPVTGETGDLTDRGNTGNKNSTPSLSNEDTSRPAKTETPKVTPPDSDPPFEVGDKVKNATGKKLLPYDGTEEVGYQQWIANKCDFTSGTIQDKKTAKDGTNYYYTGWTYNGIGVYDLGIKTRKIYFKESDLMPFDTGGYTGNWGVDGRLAMLHQKELVLNAQDTENMLKAVDIVRNIVRVIDLNAATAANAFGYLRAVGAPSTTQTIEQEVTIHAEFPNATNRGEIEEAFNSLLNRASQFANRKK